LIELWFGAVGTVLALLSLPFKSDKEGHVMRRTPNRNSEPSTASRSSATQRLAAWASAVVLLVIGVVNDAEAIPSSYSAYRTGYVANVYREHLLYDSSTDRLSYTGWNRFDYRNDAPCPCDPTLSFDGLFVWDVGVNEQGLTDAGSMRWYGDRGSGFELLASGSVLDFTHTPPNIFHDFNVTNFLRLSTVFSVDYLNPFVSGMGNRIWFDFERQLTFRDITHSPLSQDFECGPDHYTSSPDGSFSCSPWSHSGLIGLNVPEPSTLSLVLLGLFGLGTLRRARYRPLPG
jgi:hypothetical protein